MRYLLSNEFTKINETKGTVYNASYNDIEISNKAEKNSGILLHGRNRLTFNGATIYLRCVDGWAEACVVPFLVDGGGGSQDGSTIGSDSFDDNDLDEVFKT